MGIAAQSLALNARHSPTESGEGAAGRGEHWTQGCRWEEDGREARGRRRDGLAEAARNKKIDGRRNEGGVGRGNNFGCKEDARRTSGSRRTCGARGLGGRIRGTGKRSQSRPVAAGVCLGVEEWKCRQRLLLSLV